MAKRLTRDQALFALSFEIGIGVGAIGTGLASVRWTIAVSVAAMAFGVVSLFRSITKEPTTNG